MPFSEEIKTKVMVLCGRSCCICHKFCGNNMEVHHIKAHTDGGNDAIENAIPLCFDCHAIVRQYDSKHPKGIKFTEKELIQHRDIWYKHIAQGHKNNNAQGEDKIEPVKMYHEKNYQNIMLHKISTGKEMMHYMPDACGMVYDEEAETLEEVKLLGDFLQYIRELLDFDEFWDEPSDRMMTAFNLSERIRELDSAGFWVFVGRENRKLTGGIGTPTAFPVLVIRIVRKESNEIVKIEL